MFVTTRVTDLFPTSFSNKLHKQSRQQEEISYNGISHLYFGVVHRLVIQTHKTETKHFRKQACFRFR
jgi:hypothetical protein